MSEFLNGFDDSKRALAKLMARENITVQVVDGISTADFNTVTRILRIPNWPSLTPDQTDLLIGHEVGHALWTDFSYIEKLVTRKRPGKPVKGLMTYFNVIEDTRIERKMRNAFPGLRRSFYQGYQQFMKSGPIFKMNDKNEFVHPVTGATMPVSKMRLIDRINIHYKLGAFVPVPFSEDEKLWLAKIDGATSQNDALAIAEQMHAAAKEQEQKDKDDQNESQDSKQSQSGDKGDQSKKSKKGKKDNKAPKSDEQDDQSNDDASSDDDASSSDADGEQENNDRQNDSDASDSDSDASSDDSADDAGDDSDSSEGSENDSENDGESDADADGDDDASDDADGSVKGDDSEETDADAKDSDKSKVSKNQGKPNQAKRTKETDPYADNDSDPESFTDDANSKGLETEAKKAEQQDASQKIVHLLIKPLTPAIVADRTTTAKDWANEVCGIIDQRVAQDADIASFLKANEQAWNDAYLSTAKHMAIEFSRRKTAKNLARVKVGKTGKINPAKLHAYKFSDDLFLRSMTVPNGQSHGIVMIIDASGSMQNVFGNVLDQVLLFANFAKAAQIPFECYLFTTAGKIGRSGYGYHRASVGTSMGQNILTIGDSGRLVGLVNTMEGNFKKQMRALHAYRVRFGVPDSMTSHPGYVNASTMSHSFPYSDLGSTPLYMGLMIGERHLERMKQTLKLDKVMNIVITDGEDCESLFYETQGVDRYGKVTTEMQYAGQTAMVVRDTVTKKNHVIVEEYKDQYSGKKYLYCPANGLLQLLLDVNKDRHGARNVFIYLQEGGKRSGSRSIRALQYLLRAGLISSREYNSEAEAAKLGITDAIINKAFDTDSQYTIPAKHGVADLVLVIPTSTVKLREKEFDNLDVTGMTQRRVASAFVKSLSTAKTNRVFVNTVVPFLA